MFGFSDGNHFAKSGTPVIAPAFGLVDKFPDNLKIMFSGIIPESPELSGNGKIDILAVGTDAGIQGCFHGFPPVFKMLTSRFLL
jgi:hypothetical protein